MGLGPVHDLTQLVPIGDLLERQMLDRGAGDDQPVEFLIPHLLEGAVEGFHMGGGGVACLVFRHADQMQVDLQWRGPDQPRKLGFGLDFLRHQVEQRNLQRPDILPRRPFGRHHHDAFVPQNVEGGQGGGQGDGHGCLSCGGSVT